jgi:cytoskeletal protein RodZ
MNKKEKKIVQDFYESLDYQVDFNKINNKIKANDENFSKKKIKNYKVLSTVFACLLTIGVIMPFTIEYFEQKHKTNNPTTEEISSEESSLTSQQPSMEVTQETYPASSEEVTTEDEMTIGPTSGNTSSQSKPSDSLNPSTDQTTNEPPQQPEIDDSLIGKEK